MSAWISSLIEEDSLVIMVEIAVPTAAALRIERRLRSLLSCLSVAELLAEDLADPPKLALRAEQARQDLCGVGIDDVPGVARSGE